MIRFPSKSYLIDLQVRVIRHVRSFLASHILECEALLILAFVLIGVSHLPYFNIFMTVYSISSILALATVLIFRISAKVLLIPTIGMFVIVWYFSVTGNVVGAESIGNLIYFFLWVVVLSHMRDLWKHSK